MVFASGCPVVLSVTTPVNAPEQMGMRPNATSTSSEISFVIWPSVPDTRTGKLPACTPELPESLNTDTPVGVTGLRLNVAVMPGGSPLTDSVTGFL